MSCRSLDRPARCLWVSFGGERCGLLPLQLQVWNLVGKGWKGGIARAPAQKPGDAGLASSTTRLGRRGFCEVSAPCCPAVLAWGSES